MRIPHCDAKVGQRLEMLRRGRGWSQRALAQETHDRITASYVSRIERGDRFPSLSAINVLAETLSVDPHWLAWGTKKKRYIVWYAGKQFVNGLFTSSSAACAYAQEHDGEVFEVREP